MPLSPSSPRLPPCCSIRRDGAVSHSLLRPLLRMRAPYIVYVSCDPSTLARDIKMLADGYDLISAQMVDMFPQTYHLETIALLKAKD